jgi:hypothetical protein
MITEGYIRCRQRKLPSRPSHERKLYHPDDSDNDLRRDVQATGMMVVGTSVWKSRYGDGITIGCFLVSLFSSSLLWISARYKSRRHRFYHLRISVNGRWSFPVHRIHRKVTLRGTDRLRDLWIRTIAYVERLFDCFLSILFLSYYCTKLCSPGGLHLKSGIM